MAGKVALITGGSRGLGRSAAIHLAQRGVGVVLTYLGNEAAANGVVEEIESHGGHASALPLDTSQPQGFSSFERRLTSTLERHFGRTTIDFLVNNAGFGITNSLAETTEEQFDAMTNVHLKGVFFLTQRLRNTIEDGGRILNMSSGLTRFTIQGYGAYAIMKGAIEVYSRYLAQELGPQGIAVNTIAPGAIATDFGGGAVRDDPDVKGFVASVTAMGRAGEPEDIGQAIAAMLTADSQWMTGQRIEVSGGMNL